MCIRLLAPAVSLLLATTWIAGAPTTAGAQRGGGAHTGGAHTGGSATPPVDRFGEQYTEASRAWHDGRYEDALRLFSALHRETHRPELHYDLGLTYERLDRLEEAIASFQAYVDALPMARNRMQIEDRIASLREDLRARAVPVTSAQPRTTPPVSDRPILSLLGSDAPDSRPEGTAPTSTVARTETVIEGGGPQWIATWPLLVLTIAGAIATPIAWDQGWQALAVLEEDCARTLDCTQETIDGSSPRSWEIATNVLLVSTLVLGAATVITLIAEAATPTARREVQRPIAALRLSIGPGGLALRGTF